MKRNLITLLILPILLLTSCGTMSVFVKPGTTFSKNSSITIVAKDDLSGSVGELTHLLFSKGFNVISYSTAKTAVKYKDKIQGSDIVNNEFNAEVYSIQELNSIYALEINYTYYYDVFYYAYRSFSARVTDLNTGEIIMSANFRGDKSVRAVLSDLVNKMSLQIK